MTVTIPEGEDWTCSECGAPGDTSEQTLKEHWLEEHPDEWDSIFGGTDEDV